MYGRGCLSQTTPPAVKVGSARGSGSNPQALVIVSEAERWEVIEFWVWPCLRPRP